MSTLVDESSIRIVVTARDNNRGAEICEQFGRAYWLLIFDSASNSWTAIDNRMNRARKNGAGVATAEVVMGLNVSVVLTGETGPKAFRALSKAGIGVVHDVRGHADEVMHDWRAGLLRLALLPNDAGNPDCLMGQNCGQVKFSNL